MKRTRLSLDITKDQIQELMVFFNTSSMTEVVRRCVEEKHQSSFIKYMTKEIRPGGSLRK